MSFQTADLYDAHENDVKVAAPLFRAYGGKTRFFGEIVTVKCHEDNSLVGDTLKNKNGKGKVLVVDGGGSLRCALLGDMLAEKAMANEWEGIIVYGCIRDSAMVNDMAIGVRALNTNPIKSVKRGEGIFNEPVTFAGVTFKPGHYIYVDEDGILLSQNLLI